MFRLPLFRIRAFTFGTLSTFLSSVARGGLMFILIIWLQGIWLPQHGYSFTRRRCGPAVHAARSPSGMLFAGPVVRLPVRPLRRAAVRHRRHARRGRSASGCCCCSRPTSLPGVRGDPGADGFSMGLFASPNRAGGDEQPAGRGPRRGRRDEPDLPELRPGALDRDLLHADDPRARGDAARDDDSGLEAHGVPAATATTSPHLPPVSILFAAFLGYNPIQHLLGAARAPPCSAQTARRSSGTRSSRT